MAQGSDEDDTRVIPAQAGILYRVVIFKISVYAAMTVKVRGHPIVWRLIIVMLLCLRSRWEIPAFAGMTSRRGDDFEARG